MLVVNFLKTDKYSKLYSVKCNFCVDILKVSRLSLLRTHGMTLQNSVHLTSKTTNLTGRFIKSRLEPALVTGRCLSSPLFCYLETVLYLSWRLGSSVITVTGLRAAPPRGLATIPSKGKNFSGPPNVRRVWGPPNSTGGNKLASISQQFTDMWTGVGLIED